MKHIIIAGSARSGKTTLAQMLKARFPVYNVFHGDYVREWLIELYGRDRAAQLTHSYYYAKEISLLLKTMLRNPNELYILDWSRIYPSLIQNISEAEYSTVIYLGHGGIDYGGLMEQCRRYETPKDFTSTLSDSQLEEACKRWSAVDKQIMEECKTYGHQYYITATNRAMILESIVNDKVKNL